MSIFGNTPLEVKGCVAASGANLVIQLNKEDVKINENYEIHVFSQGVGCPKNGIFDSVKVQLPSSSCGAADELDAYYLNSRLMVSFKISDTCSLVSAATPPAHLAIAEIIAMLALCL